ncbi:IS110 family transposase [Dactylosporangium sp. CA-233914]|uniref:IS110 family transposase n=1 Tax=Dactylosporangium sp. CA-233914 TaxID=3239934 RepID=UPI003D91E070
MGVHRGTGVGEGGDAVHAALLRYGGNRQCPLPHPTTANRRVTKVWDVPATTNAVCELADHLVAEQVERVVVESTSDYWRVFFYLLEARGLTVWLVNANDVKQVSGRPKTDKLDAVWLAKLNERGMLRPSFVPPAEIRQLRDYTRLRLDLTADRTRHKQRMEKLLEDALIKLSTVALDIFGVSGRAMLEELIAGNRDPQALAQMARGQLRAKHAALVQALTGRFDDHHALLARILLDNVDRLDRQIDQLTTTFDQAVTAIPAAGRPEVQPPTSGNPPGTAEPLPAIDRLDEIPGIARHTAHTIIAEIGLDMRAFPTPGHLVSWAKLSPRTIVRSTQTHRQDRQGQPLPQRRPRPRRRQRRQDQHLPRRTLPATGQTPRQTQSPRRRRPLHPRHRLAPADRPHRPVP